MTEHHHSAMEAVSSGNNGGNGNGSVLTKISKGSWIVIVLISAITASVTGFFSMREAQTVGFATVDQRLTEHEGRIKKNEDELREMVPATVHAEREKRYDLQNEFIKFRLDQLEKEIAGLRNGR